MAGDPLTPQTTWSQYTTEIYLSGKPPIIGSYDYRVVEERAREATKDNHCAFSHSILRITSIDEKSSLAAYLYTFGSAGIGSTYNNNLEALKQWRIIPRMLRDATHRNLDVTIAALPEPALTAPPRPPFSASSCPHPYS
jgi:lactate 2-monooxygenase